MIIIQSNPLISDKELGSYLEPLGKIAAITHTAHRFAKHIDSGFRLIFIVLHNDVKTRDIPVSIRTSDGVWRLFFKGKLYSCRDCCTQHTYAEGCPMSQHSEQENHPTTQDKQQGTDSTENVPGRSNTIP